MEYDIYVLFLQDFVTMIALGKWGGGGNAILKAVLFMLKVHMVYLDGDWYIEEEEKDYYKSTAAIASHTCPMHTHFLKAPDFSMLWEINNWV